MPPEAKTEEKADFWQKLAGTSTEDLHNIEVLIHRVFPEVDTKTNYPIDGHCATVKAGGLSLESVYELVRGGTYRLQARTVDTKHFFAQTTVKFPGAPKIVLPGSDQGEKTPPPPRADRNDPGRGSFEAGRRAGEEQARREAELAYLRKSVERLEHVPATPQGHGNGELVQTLLTTVLGLAKNTGGNGQPLSITDVLTFINKARDDGKEAAKEIAEAIASYAPGAGGDTEVQKELVTVLGKLFDNAQSRKQSDKAASKVQKSDEPAAAMLVAIRDGIADTIDKEFGDFGKTAAQTVRGARTLPELLSAIHQTLAYIGEQLREEDVDEDETPGEPGSGEKTTPPK